MCYCFFYSDKEKKLTKIQKRQCIEIMLEKEFPLVLTIILVIFNILAAFASIAIQIEMIIFQKDFYYIACG